MIFNQVREQAALGAVLANPMLYFNIVQALNGKDFADMRHQYIWDAIQTIVGRNEDFDYLAVTQELRDTEKLADIGGMIYLEFLLNEFGN